jgi:putative transposase
MADSAPAELSSSLVCDALDLPRATLYRRRAKAAAPADEPCRRSSPRALTDSERNEVLAVLNSDEFANQAPAAVHAALLDRGVYMCAVRTMYRILEANNQVKERRNVLRHPSYSAPELIATAPNQVWSWDITKLLGPVKMTYFYLYVIIDIFSRYVVAWTLDLCESASLAQRLIDKACIDHSIPPGQLTLHADRGASMKSDLVAKLLSDLGVTKSHSRPHVSNDNPYSEAGFKTLKYRPEFPDRFSSFDDARSFCRRFFQWYNFEHHHCGIALHTPYHVHYGRYQELDIVRQAALDNAFSAHPERFVRSPPRPPALPTAAWINKPKPLSQASDASDDT